MGDADADVMMLLKDLSTTSSLDSNSRVIR